MNYNSQDDISVLSISGHLHIKGVNNMKRTLTTFIMALAIMISVGAVGATAQAKTYYLIGNVAGTSNPSHLVYKGSKVKLSGGWKKANTASKAYEAKTKTFKKTVKISSKCKYIFVSTRGEYKTSFKKFVKNNKIKKGDSLMKRNWVMLKIKNGKLVEYALQ